MGQLILSGFAVGSTYAITALSLVLVYRAINLVNFAQGDLAMFGAFLGVVCYKFLHVPLALSFALSVAAMGIVGLITYYATYEWLKEKHFLSFIIATIALGLILENVAGIVTAYKPLAFPSFFVETSVRIVGAYLAPQQLFVIAITGVLIGLLQWFFSHTRIGMLLQATAQDQEAAQMLGVPVKRMIAVTFVISAMLSGVAGLLLAPLYFVTANLGSTIILYAFAASILGGFGSVLGAIVGGLGIGLVQSFVSFFMPSSYSEVITFGILIVTLLIIPSGIFGEKVVTRV